MDISENQNINLNLDVVDTISKLLDSGKYKEALSIPNENNFRDSFKDNCWDLISMIVEKVQDDTVITKPSLYSTCEELLYLVTEQAQPEEALLEFIERLEVAKNDAQFAISLGPLQHLLKKLTHKRGRSLEWCLNSTSTYIENIPILDYPLEGKERLLMDSDSNIRRIIKIYALLPPFYEPFMQEVVSNNLHTKQIINAFIISLLGKPLIYIDLDPDTNSMGEARSTTQTMILDFSSMEKNVYKLLPYLEKCVKETNKNNKGTNNSNEECMPYDHREKVNLTTLSGLFYVVLSGHFAIPECALPQVYSTEYLVHSVLPCVPHLLQFTQYGPQSKGIFLCKALLQRLPENVPHYELSSSKYFDLCSKLVNTAIYSMFETLRKASVKLIEVLINKFEFKGKWTLIKYIIQTSNHSGMIGFAITLFKNSINEAFQCHVFPECFQGAAFMQMLQKICHLPHGAQSDLVELADQIITALNFLRYLTIRDSKNLTGIRDNLDFIESKYLETLRVALNMSKAHYEAKLKDIEAGKSHPDNNINVSVNVGGNILDTIPSENKKEIINSALNAFHLMEGLVARLAECINMNKMNNLNI